MNRPSPRVVWLSTETPDRDGGGGQRRQFFQLRALVDGGAVVSVVTLAGPQDDSSVRAIADVKRFSTPEHGDTAAPRLDAILAGERFERAIVAHVESVPHVHCELARQRIPWLLDFQNVNSRWHRARREPRAAVTWLLREHAALRRATRATACSREERDALALIARGTRIEVAGNGIAPEEWPADALAATRQQRIALFGSWTHTPNREGAEWLARDVWPLVHAAAPQARLVLAGPGAPPAAIVAAAGIEHVGRVESLARLLGGVGVAVVPIVTGIGSRVKFGEALASGAAVVSTSAGAEGFDVAGSFLRADGAEAFARACIGLLREPERAAALGRAGRRVALESLTWERTSGPLKRWAAEA